MNYEKFIKTKKGYTIVSDYFVEHTTGKESQNFIDSTVVNSQGEILGVKQLKKSKLVIVSDAALCGYGSLLNKK